MVGNVKKVFLIIKSELEFDDDEYMLKLSELIIILIKYTGPELEVLY